MDLLEKFKIAICKRLETDEEIIELVEDIEARAIDSKILTTDLQNHMEKRGITIRDAIYDQLACYFDIDHSGSIYIASFCNFLRDPQHFNFFKLNPAVLSAHITDYIRNCLASRPEQLDTLELELKKEMFRATSKIDNDEEVV